MKFPARYWKKEKGGSRRGQKAEGTEPTAEGEARCELCPNRCLVASGKRGRCLARGNVDGELVALNYGEVVSMSIDPIEKKPLYHFLPGTEILSVASYGCNLLCPFCQNWETSQRIAPSRYVSPEDLARAAQRSRTPAVAFTYTEPLVWFEYLMDACPALRKSGIRCVLVTNGMISPEPLEELLPHVDAMNVDLKSIRPNFYTSYIKGDLGAAQNTLKVAVKQCHVEVTNLLIPGRNDSESELDELTAFVASLGRRVPLHFSRYFPKHREDEPATPVSRVLEAARLAKKRLDYVYVGNLAAPAEFRDTFCPACGHCQIGRSSYSGEVVGIRDGKCAGCGRPADVIT